MSASCSSGKERGIGKERPACFIITDKKRHVMNLAVQHIISGFVAGSATIGDDILMMTNSIARSSRTGTNGIEVFLRMLRKGRSTTHRASAQQTGSNNRHRLLQSKNRQTQRT